MLGSIFDYGATYYKMQVIKVTVFVLFFATCSENGCNLLPPFAP
jgi:hypothetical protein